MDSDLPLSTAPSLPSAEEEAAGRGGILARLRERIVAFAASRYAGAHAEDLAQEVLVVIHEKYGHLHRLEDLVPLAFQILRFKLKDGKADDKPVATLPDNPEFLMWVGD